MLASTATLHLRISPVVITELSCVPEDLAEQCTSPKASLSLTEALSSWAMCRRPSRTVLHCGALAHLDDGHHGVELHRRSSHSGAYCRSPSRSAEAFLKLSDVPAALESGPIFAGPLHISPEALAELSFTPAALVKRHYFPERLGLEQWRSRVGIMLLSS